MFKFCNDCYAIVEATGSKCPNGKDHQVFDWEGRSPQAFTPDDCNPAYILSTTDYGLLVAIIKGKINMVALASRELANRGLDADGSWVGFDEAMVCHKRRMIDTSPQVNRRKA